MIKNCLFCNIEFIPIRKTKVFCSKKCVKKNYLITHPLLKVTSDKKYYSKNKEKLLEWGKKYRALNKERIAITKNKYYQSHKDNLNQYRRTYDNEKRRKDILYRLKYILRSRTRDIFKVKKHIKTNSLYDYLGCSVIELKEYLEIQFKDNMNWDNYGKWHIDHIIPLSSAKTEEELYKLCNYKNLQPLWAEENLKKGAKWEKLSL